MDLHLSHVVLLVTGFKHLSYSCCIANTAVNSARQGSLFLWLTKLLCWLPLTVEYFGGRILMYTSLLSYWFSLELDKRLIELMLSMLDIHFSVKGKFEVYVNLTEWKRKVISHRSHTMKRDDVFSHICYYCGLSICGW